MPNYTPTKHHVVGRGRVRSHCRPVRLGELELNAIQDAIAQHIMKKASGGAAVAAKTRKGDGMPGSLAKKLNSLLEKVCAAIWVADSGASSSAEKGAACTSSVKVSHSNCQRPRSFIDTTRPWQLTRPDANLAQSGWHCSVSKNKERVTKRVTCW